MWTRMKIVFRAWWRTSDTLSINYTVHRVSDEDEGELADDALGTDDGEMNDDEVAGLGFSLFICNPFPNHLDVGIYVLS